MVQGWPVQGPPGRRHRHVRCSWRYFQAPAVDAFEGFHLGSKILLETRQGGRARLGHGETRQSITLLELVKSRRRRGIPDGHEMIQKASQCTPGPRGGCGPRIHICYNSPGEHAEGNSTAVFRVCHHYPC